MKKIIFYQYRSSELELYYTACGCRIDVVVKNQPLTMEEDALILTTLHAVKNESLLSVILKEHRKNIIIVGKEIRREESEYLAENGISKIISERNLLNHKDMLLDFKKNKLMTTDRIIIYDSGDWSVRIAADILDAYNVEFAIFTDYAELLNVMENEKDAVVLLNLSADDYDINAFVKQAQIIPAVKQIPIIPFKNTKAGMSTISLGCGLHKIAKVILSNNEILSFLCSLLMKKDFHSVLSNSLEKLDVNPTYSKNTLRQIYFQPGADFFSLKHPHPQCDYADIAEQIKRIESVFYRMMLFEWMCVLLDE